jgi:UDP-GlcNAc:undecaprenyl-phosphate/decaprenyl-phosphate GlcNAc-1-phosphate transferase
MPTDTLIRCAAALVISVVVGCYATLGARRLAIRWGVLSKPTQRGVHREPVPYFGGLGILVGALAGASVLPAFDPATLGVVAGAIAIAVIGAFDDAFDLKWSLKMGLEVLVALGAWALGVRIHEWSPPTTESYFTLAPVLSATLTVLWLVSVTNAMNFIDGLDGLAGGGGAIASLALTVIACMWIALKGHTWERAEVAVLGAACAGGCIGFLRFNFHPARVFMGDCGALMLGWCLASLAVLGAFKSTLLYLCPIVLLGLPLSDTAWAVIRRLWRRQSLATADREHIHHRVLSRVASQRWAVLILYAVSLVLAGLAVYLGRP